MYNQSMLGYDSILMTEEYITPEEYIDRFTRGEIDPSTVRYADCDPETGRLGGFWVRLKTPRYRVAKLPAVTEALGTV